MRALVFIVGLLISAPASAFQMICTIQQGNQVLDDIRISHDEVPVLQMKIAGNVQAILAASPDGKFILMGMMPDGRACIFAIGEGMKTAEPSTRFVAESTP